MGWCPICKNEYVEGIKVCPKCDCSLFDTKEEAMRMSLNPEEGFDDNEKKESPYDDFVSQYVSESSDSEEAFLNALKGGSKIVKAEGVDLSNANVNEDKILSERSANASSKNVSKQRQLRSPEIYQDKNVKAKDMKDSAICLLFIGILGIAAVILVLFDVIKLNLELVGKYISCGLMGVFFVALTAMGFYSLKSFNSLKESAGKDDDKTKEIEKWYKANLTKEGIDKGLFAADDNTEEELKYFKRISKIAFLVKSQYEDLDNAFLDHICEEIYQWLFE